MKQGDILEYAIHKSSTKDAESVFPTLCSLCDKGDERVEIEQFTVQRIADRDIRAIVKGWHIDPDGGATSFVWFVSSFSLASVMGRIETGFRCHNYGGIPDRYPRPRRRSRSLKLLHVDAYSIDSSS